MQNSWRVRLGVIVGLAWTSAVAAQTLTTQDPAGEHQGPRPGPAPAGWSAAPERPEPGGRPGPRQETSDETRMIKGDLSEGSGSRWLGDILVGDPTFDEV